MAKTYAFIPILHTACSISEIGALGDAVVCGVVVVEDDLVRESSGRLGITVAASVLP